MIRRFFEVCYISIYFHKISGEVVIRRFFEVCYIDGLVFHLPFEVVIRRFLRCAIFILFFVFPFDLL